MHFCDKCYKLSSDTCIKEDGSNLILYMKKIINSVVIKVDTRKIDSAFFNKNPFVLL